MSEDSDLIIPRDSVRKNVLVTSISQGITVVVGLVSSSLLVRTIDISWTISDYAHLKVLMYWSGFLSIVVLLGVTTGVVKSVSEQAHKRELMGSVIGVSLLSVTVAFLGTAFVTVFLAEQVGFLTGDTPAVTSELRVLWFFVLLAMLPSAYFYIAGSVFTGLQRMKRTLYVDIVYSGSRGVILVLLFLTNMITITNVLYMYLGTTLLGFIAAAFILRREIRSEGISIELRDWREVSGPLFRVSSVILALALLASFNNTIVPLIVDYVGSDTDLARYAIAQRSTNTLKAFLYVPFGVLLPNIAGMRARGEERAVKERFEEAYRIIIPALVFAFLSVFSFGHHLLGAIYGVRVLDVTGGLSAAQFFVAMSPILLIIPLTSLYGNLMLAMDRMKALLILGSVSITFQSLWIIIMQPRFGVLAIAFWWVAVIPILIGHHLYCKKSVKIHIRGSYIVKVSVLCVVFALIAVGSSIMADLLVNSISFLPFLQFTTLSSLARLLFVIPLWYVFLALCLSVGVMGVSDFENLKLFLRQIPPLWWVSRPLLRIIERVTIKKGNGL